MKDYELLEKQASMMRMAEKHGIADWRDLVMIEISSGHFVRLYDFVITLNGLDSYKFALGVVEGRPVFEGDILYDTAGIKYVAGYAKDIEAIWAKPETSFLYGESDTGNKFFCQIENAKTFTWNPPKPKTILVELLVEDAEDWAKSKYNGHCPSNRFYEACRKALEAIK